MAGSKHVALVADTDKKVTVTGRGHVLVTNHAADSGEDEAKIFVNPLIGADAVATVAGDNMICIGIGGYRVLDITDEDGSVDVHLISHLPVTTVSVEIVDPRMFD